MQSMVMTPGLSHSQAALMPIACRERIERAASQQMTLPRMTDNARAARYSVTRNGVNGAGALRIAGGDAHYFFRRRRDRRREIPEATARDAAAASAGTPA